MCVCVCACQLLCKLERNLYYTGISGVNRKMYVKHSVCKLFSLSYYVITKIICTWYIFVLLIRENKSRTIYTHYVYTHHVDWHLFVNRPYRYGTYVHVLGILMLDYILLRHSDWATIDWSRSRESLGAVVVYGGSSTSSTLQMRGEREIEIWTGICNE